MQVPRSTHPYIWTKEGWLYLAVVMDLHSLKVEQVNECRYRTREEAKADVFEYIEAYYNALRRHSTLNHLSPREFERRMAA